MFRVHTNKHKYELDNFEEAKRLADEICGVVLDEAFELIYRSIGFNRTNCYQRDIEASANRMRRLVLKAS